MPAPAFSPVPLSGADAAGVLHSDGRRFLRGIHAAGAMELRALLASGLIEALCARGLFPATRVLESGIPDEMKGYALVLEHEGIHPVTYPREWSFGMLKSAAIAFLDILELSLRYGYMPKDAHLFNIVFRHTNPVWIDIGSFVRRDRPGSPLPWQAEFNAGVLAPLRMWADGSGYLAQSAIRHPSSHFPPSELYAYRLPLLRGHSAIARRLRWLLAARSSAGSIGEDSTRARIFRTMFAPSPTTALRRLRGAVARLKCPPTSVWGGYQDEYLDDGGKISLPKRFESVIDLLAAHQPASVVELAGNSGVLSQAIAERNPGMAVICTDFDPVAIDRLYERVRPAAPPNLSMAVLDFMVPEYTPAEIAPERRFAADCVLALAVTHHLLLTQGYDYETVFARIRAYTRNLAYIEFMPLGLHDGKSAPAVPGWYNLDAFSAAFSRHFDRLHMEQLDDNRILFVGRRSPQGQS